MVFFSFKKGKTKKPGMGKGRGKGQGGKGANHWGQKLGKKKKNGGTAWRMGPKPPRGLEWGKKTNQHKKKETGYTRGGAEERRLWALGTKKKTREGEGPSQSSQGGKGNKNPHTPAQIQARPAVLKKTWKKKTQTKRGRKGAQGGHQGGGGGGGAKAGGGGKKKKNADERGKRDFKKKILGRRPK